MKRPIAALAPFALAVTVLAAPSAAQTAQTLPAETLLNREILRALDEELSVLPPRITFAPGSAASRAASPGFHEAIAYVMDRAKAFGLERCPRRNVSGRRHHLVRHAARQPWLARRRRLSRRGPAAAPPHHRL